MDDERTRIYLYNGHPQNGFEELLKSKIERKGLSRAEALKDIFETATKTNTNVNKMFGLDGE